jgi:hypothetical protein
MTSANSPTRDIAGDAGRSRTLVAALRERAEQLRQAELDRFRVRMSRLDEDERAVVDAVTRGLVVKLLHDPCVRLRGYAGSARGDQLMAARRCSSTCQTFCLTRVPWASPPDAALARSHRLSWRA